MNEHVGKTLARRAAPYGQAVLPAQDRHEHPDEHQELAIQRHWQSICERHGATMLGIRDVPTSPMLAKLAGIFWELAPLGTDERAVPAVVFHRWRALADAARLGLVPRNVSELARPPRKTSHEMRTLSPAEVRRFLAVVQGDRFEALYILALSTGMREGELLGLRWQDIDLARATLQVRMNVQETLGRYILAETKTAHSRRSIGLIGPAVAALRRHEERQQVERAGMGQLYDATLDLVFPNGYGGLMIPHNITKRSFKRHLEAAGLPRSVRFHDLRHTAATLLLSSGVNVKVVSEMLGHADVGITLRVYAHVLPHMQQAAVAAMEGLIGEPLVTEPTDR